MDLRYGPHSYVSPTMSWLREIAGRASTCPAAAVGALAISSENEVLAVTVNGSPAGLENCQDVGCNWVGAGIAGVGRDHARHLHAETALIAACARMGLGMRGCLVKATNPPCPTCALMLIACGVRVVVIPEPTADWLQIVGDALQKAGVEIVVENE